MAKTIQQSIVATTFCRNFSKNVTFIELSSAALGTLVEADVREGVGACHAWIAAWKSRCVSGL